VSRAAVTFEADERGDFQPVTVWLATPKRLAGRTLTGNPAREARVAEMMRTAKPPTLRDGTTGTLEDCIGYFVGDQAQGWPGALGNGHTTWASEVRPEPTVEALFQREVLKIAPKPLVRPDLQPTTEAPTNLSGYKKVRP
jgi:hypothetical protein